MINVSKEQVSVYDREAVRYIFDYVSSYHNINILAPQNASEWLHVVVYVLG